MIKVTVIEKETNKDGIWKEEIKVKEHKEGYRANVYNGVLTIYVGGSEPSFQDAIAGYMPNSWLSWQFEKSE